MSKLLLGIDIGGSGIKGALVDLEQGKFDGERYRIPTPPGGKPKEVVQVVGKIISHFDYSGAVGCGFPAAVRNGTALTAANVDRSWIGTDISALVQQKTGCPCFVLNDADAAATAMVAHGKATSVEGTVLVITVGTGLGTALFHKGMLVPNTELGHIELMGKDAEEYASDRIRKKEKLSWKKWGERLSRYLQKMEALFWPELIILGGGVSKNFDSFENYLKLKAGTKIIPSTLRNKAGIIGAALAAERHFSQL